jgi:hypothetical protein
LGDVTPAQVAQINTTLAAQQNEIDALETRVTALEPAVKLRRGVITGVLPNDSTPTVSFVALPDVNYAVSITPVCTGTIGTSATPLFSLNDASKTTTGFSIRVENNISNITSIEWMAVHTS